MQITKSEKLADWLIEHVVEDGIEYIRTFPFKAQFGFYWEEIHTYTFLPQEKQLELEKKYKRYKKLCNIIKTK